MQITRLLTALVLSASCALPAHAFDMAARAAFAYDVTTDTVILEKECRCAYAAGIHVKANDFKHALRSAP